MGPDEISSVDVGRGYRLIAFDTIGSTNTEAMRRLKAGDAGRLWVYSPEQTAGRGRRGRAWATTSGNLAASLALIVDATPAKAATLGFVAGLALASAVHHVLPDYGAYGSSGDRARDEAQRIALKWPNDVTLGGAKLSGILLEAEPLGDGRLAVVIGMGVNVVAAPEGLPYRAASLKGLGVDIDAERLLARLMEAWPDLYATWQQSGGFAVIRERWLGLAQGLGDAISVSIGTRVVRGRFETIDADGRLILMDEDGVRHAIAAGDVHFGGAASTRSEG